MGPTASGCRLPRRPTAKADRRPGDRRHRQRPRGGATDRQPQGLLAHRGSGRRSSALTGAIAVEACGAGRPPRCPDDADPAARGPGAGPQRLGLVLQGSRRRDQTETRHALEKRPQGQIRMHDRKDGLTTYSLRVRVYGRREVVTLGTEADGRTYRKAERKLEQVLVEIQVGVWRPPSAGTGGVDRTFHVFASRWWAARKSKLRPATQADYEWRLKKHLLPFFAPVQGRCAGCAGARSTPRINGSSSSRPRRPPVSAKST